MFFASRIHTRYAVSSRKCTGLVRHTKVSLASAIARQYVQKLRALSEARIRGKKIRVSAYLVGAFFKNKQKARSSAKRQYLRARLAALRLRLQRALLRKGPTAPLIPFKQRPQAPRVWWPRRDEKGQTLSLQGQVRTRKHAVLGMSTSKLIRRLKGVRSVRASLPTVGLITSTPRSAPPTTTTAAARRGLRLRCRLLYKMCPAKWARTAVRTKEVKGFRRGKKFFTARCHRAMRRRRRRSRRIKRRARQLCAAIRRRNRLVKQAFMRRRPRRRIVSVGPHRRLVLRGRRVYLRLRSSRAKITLGNILERRKRYKRRVQRPLRVSLKRPLAIKRSILVRRAKITGDRRGNMLFKRVRYTTGRTASVLKNRKRYLSRMGPQLKSRLLRRSHVETVRAANTFKRATALFDSVFAPLGVVKKQPTLVVAISTPSQTLLVGETHTKAAGATAIPPVFVDR